MWGGAEKQVPWKRSYDPAYNGTTNSIDTAVKLANAERMRKETMDKAVKKSEKAANALSEYSRNPTKANKEAMEKAYREQLEAMKYHGASTLEASELEDAVKRQTKKYKRTQTDEPQHEGVVPGHSAEKSSEPDVVFEGATNTFGWGGANRYNNYEERD